MKYLVFSFFIASLFLSSAPLLAEPLLCPPLLDSSQKEIYSGEQIDLCQFTDTPVLIVNFAPNCSKAPEFTQLQQLSEQFAAQGLVILSFISRDFSPNTPVSSLSCLGDPNKGLYVFALSKVSGTQANQVFKQLVSLGAPQPQANWHTYLVSAEGKLIANFSAQQIKDKTVLEQAITDLFSLSN